jgi:hypothetical protein
MKSKILVLVLLLLLLVGCGASESDEKYVKNVNELISEFTAAGLNVGGPATMEASDFGMAPYVSQEAMIFEVETEMNSRVFKVTNKDDLSKLKAYYDDLGKASALFYSHTYSKGEYLIQMNGEISKAVFDKYVEVMNKVIK